ncbi:flagellar hook capping FlgD N-terminal domain-containing protein [Neobacillus sp. YIM B06451]|uniref:flagellar hook capping FlgD N-terminal domain-containing protein n=1 Tax=Neobacillus sp. YIM B06451 TaxID=3070994 RepID=UPI00292D61A0|nr:flagellar hook capping FlgD N-terminal domain-containing protein [Neobacillus sp. YIM B06451]
MSSIQSINSYSTATIGNTNKQELGKEAFLKILVTQLQQQDPTQPQKDGEFIGQMAQLSVLEQLSNLNKSLTAYLESSNNISQYSYVMGNKVTWTNPETNAQESGVVTGVHYRDNLVYFKVGDQEILSSAITSMELEK